MYGFLRVVDPIIRFVWRRRVVGLERVADLRVPGRRSGRERATLVTVLNVDGRWYVGRLYGGPEREAVIRATWSQQPFPGNVIYALARRRVRDVGVYFRLNPLPPPGSEPA